MLKEKWEKDFDKKFGTWELLNPTKHSVLSFICNLIPKLKWTKKFPTKEGLYWFYGYRYRRIPGYKQSKKFMLIKVRKDGVGNSMYIADGQFMYKSEVEEALFCKTAYPKIPKWEE